MALPQGGHLDDGARDLRSRTHLDQTQSYNSEGTHPRSQTVSGALLLNGVKVLGLPPEQEIRGH